MPPPRCMRPQSLLPHALTFPGSAASSAPLCVSEAGRGALPGPRGPPRMGRTKPGDGWEGRGGREDARAPVKNPHHLLLLHLLLWGPW